MGNAVLDEAQKEPGVFDKVKYAFDAGEITFSVLLGSSRLLLLDRIRESLAGRSFLCDLWPLMPSEVRHADSEEVSPPLLDRLLSSEEGVNPPLRREPEVLVGREEERRRQAVDHLLMWGGMPELLRLDDRDRREWLRSYEQTYLERDLSDLARLRDLLPFKALQRLAMLRSGQLLSYSELARDAGIGISTARRYLEYLRICYQVILLQPYRRNLTSSVVKTPKIYWSDLGLLRQATAQWGPATGSQFETFVVAETHKWVSTMARDASLSFYRTRSGREVDLVVQTPHGVIAVEIKARETVGRPDVSSLNALAEALGGEWLGGLLVYRGRRLAPITEDRALWAVPVHRLF